MDVVRLRRSVGRVCVSNTAVEDCVSDIDDIIYTPHATCFVVAQLPSTGASSPKWCAITAYHAVSEPRRQKKKFLIFIYNGRYEAEVTRYSARCDAAVLVFQGPDNLEPLKLSEEPPEIYCDLALVHFPPVVSMELKKNQLDPVVTRGGLTLLDMEEGKGFGNWSSFPGSSGGPVLDLSAYNVVGVHCAVLYHSLEDSFSLPQLEKEHDGSALSSSSAASSSASSTLPVVDEDVKTRERNSSTDSEGHNVDAQKNKKRVRITLREVTSQSRSEMAVFILSTRILERFGHEYNQSSLAFLPSDLYD